MHRVFSLAPRAEEVRIAYEVVVVPAPGGAPIHDLRFSTAVDQLSSIADPVRPGLLRRLAHLYQRLIRFQAPLVADLWGLERGEKCRPCDDRCLLMLSPSALSRRNTSHGLRSTRPWQVAGR